MKQMKFTLFITTMILFANLAFATDKVVVVPLTRCANGLTNCSGKCVDTLNNPSFCGDCMTTCGENEYCSNGTCGLPAAIMCSSGSECISGYCIEDFCRKDIKLVFVTSNTYTGNLGGLSGADEKCQQLADNAKLGGTYKAWLSDNTGSPSTRFNKYDYYYILINGTIIARSWNDLTDGSILAPIDTDENKNLVTDYAFSNTNPDGGWGTDWDYECENWSAAVGSYANIGSTTATNDDWTFYNYVGCSRSSHLYCFEQ